MPSSEYVDDERVLDQKVALIANLVRAAKYCCAYTGAGLSKASGIPDYASKAADSVVKSKKPLTSIFDAQPT